MPKGEPVFRPSQKCRGRSDVASHPEFASRKTTRMVDCAKVSRVVGVYPETKHPTYHADANLKLEDRLLAILGEYGYTRKDSPVIIQSFEVSNLQYLRPKTSVRLVQLVDGDDYDFKTGKVTFAAPFDRPYDWTKVGKTALFDTMLTPAGLAEIKKYADGVGPRRPSTSSFIAWVLTDSSLISRTPLWRRVPRISTS